jgi:hypothetical protein
MYAIYKNSLVMKTTLSIRKWQEYLELNTLHKSKELRSKTTRNYCQQRKHAFEDKERCHMIKYHHMEIYFTKHFGICSGRRWRCLMCFWMITHQKLSNCCDDKIAATMSDISMIWQRKQHHKWKKLTQG